MSSPADRAFAAFQRSGDPQQLAAVFDATAAELLRVARYLARDAHAAEDLLQATFLTAIERRDRYDPALPVLPWLLGILANGARGERRRAGRRSPPVAGGEQRSAAEHAADAERDARLHAAVRALPQPYREVVLLQVEHGLDSGQIAEVTGRKAATVRTQLARGLELLRGALPAGVGAALAGAVGAAPAVSAAALGAVRAAVLLRATAAAGTTVAADGAAAAVGTLFGGIAMKQLAAVAGGVLLLALGWWWTVREDAAPAPPHAADGAPRAIADTSAAATASRRDAGGAVPGERAAPAAADTAALRVVVRHEDGTAAPGVGVYVAGERLVPFGREATTGADGVARLDALPPGAVVVKPDRGAAQPLTLVAGANELELRLTGGVDVDGRVRTALGRQPVPHATVFALSREHHDHAQRVAQADADGAFALRGVAAGTRLFARAPGWQPSDPKHESVPALANGPVQVELRVGAPAHSLRGRVTLPGGAPAPFAQVAIAVDEHARRFPGGLRERGAGMQRQRDVDAFLLRADAVGEYATDEVPEGEALVVARAAAGAAPGIALVPIAIAPGADHRCDVELQPGAELFGTVRDESGAPFAGLPMVVEWKGTDRVRFEGAFDHLLACVTATTDGDGGYRLPALLPGDHDVMPQARLGSDVRIEQHGGQRERVTLLAGESRRLDLVVARRGDLRVRLLGPDGAPVAGFGIWVEAKARPTPRMSQLEAQRTDSDGRVRVRGLPRGDALCVSAFGPRPKSAGDRLVDRFPAQQWPDVRVQDDELVLRLDALPAAELAGRFVAADGSTLTAKSAWLFRDEWDEKRGFAAVDGTFALDALPAGRYWLRPSFESGYARPFLGPFDVAAGQRLDLGAVTVPQPARLRVTVLAADGAAAARPRAWLRSSFPDDRNVSLVAKDGALASSSLTPGKYRLWVAGGDVAPAARDLDLGAGEQRELRLELPRGFAQPFVVASPTAVAPAQGGWVVDYSLFTDDDTLVRDEKPTALRFSLPLTRGRWMIRWNVPGGPRTSTWFTVGDEPSPTIVLRAQ